jgi:hypothetical protein
MKTIKQIANEIGVSKTAIRKRLTPELQTKFVETVSGVIYISSEGESYIKSTFMAKTSQTKFAETSGEVFTLINILRDELAIKNKEIGLKNEQIRELNARLAETNNALITAQQSAHDAQALHAGTIQQRLIDGSVSSNQQQQIREPARKSFFKRFFGFS